MNLAAYFSNYFTVRRELVEAVKNMTPEQLAWKASNYPNSIGKLLVHIAETEYWWVTVVALKKEETFDENKFENLKELSEILGSLEYYHDEFSRFLENEDIDNWDRIFYEIKGRDEKVSQRWLVWHVVEHQARHRGQIFMLMRMQGLEVPRV